MLKVPQKLLEILTKINDYRYLRAYGGRGGAKSQTIGRIMLYLGEMRKLRIVCGRETQNTISESVYSLLVDLIRSFNLNYEIQASKLIHRETGTEITFRGFRQQGAFNIQGMEGIDIVWIDEAQAITKKTIDVLIPTIRKDNAKIMFSMNPHVVTDPVTVFCKGRSDCLEININYDENIFCTAALKREAEECRKKSEDDYQHIWMGLPLAQAEDAVFSMEELEATSIDKYRVRQGYGMRLAGHDIARYGDDKCSTYIIQQMGALHWEEVFVDEWGKRDLNYTTGKILEHHRTYECSKSIIDEDGMGGGPLDSLTMGRGETDFVGFRNTAIAYKDNKDFANVRTLNAYKLKDMVRAGHIAINDIETMKELCRLRYTFDHSQRRILVSKEKMRNDKSLTSEERRSPNKADSLIMAVSLIGDVKQKQDNQYYSRPQYVQEESLFGIAGVR